MAGLTGGMIGGFAWMILAGIAIGSPLLMIGPIFLAGIGIAGGRWLIRRKRRVRGPALLWVFAFNLVAINLYYDDIPERVLGLSTGKQFASLTMLNILILLVGLGLGLGLWLNRREGS